MTSKLFSLIIVLSLALVGCSELLVLPAAGGSCSSVHEYRDYTAEMGSASVYYNDSNSTGAVEGLLC